jgi:hypothetical protein
VEKFTAFGIQYRPILAAPILNTGPVQASGETFEATVTPEIGHDFGMVLRWGIGERFAVETGIDQIRRNFTIEVEDLSSNYSDRMDFGMLAYQIPLRALFYIQLGQDLYTNVAVGAVGDIFPTDWSISEGRSKQYTQRFNWLIGGFTANVGLEYRTSSSGSFYFGGTYHRPLGNAPVFSANIAAMEVEYRKDSRLYDATLTLPGDYITLDFKYFFPHSKDGS